MPANNLKIADIFEQIVDILDIQGGNFFRIRGYRQGAQQFLSDAILAKLAQCIATFIYPGPSRPSVFCAPWTALILLYSPIRPDVY